MQKTDRLKLILLGAFLAVGSFLLLKPKGRSMAELKAWVRTDFPDVQQISIAELQDREKKPNPPLLIDVRTADEYKVSHLPGAMHLEPNSLTRQTITRFGTNQPAVFYCSVGYRAAMTARNVARVGWTNVAVLEGSIFEWSQKGLPLQCENGVTKWVHPYAPSYVRLLPPEARPPLPRLRMILNELPLIEKWRIGFGSLFLVLLLSWESLQPAFSWFRNGRERWHHGGRNYCLGLINIILSGLVFVNLWLLTANWADAHQFGLMYWLGMPNWARVIFSVLLLDAWTYCWHRLNHKVPVLWRFHRTHHTEQQMDVSSAVRFHFGEIAMSSLLRIPLILLLGLKFHELVLYELLLFTVVQFHHANITLPSALERALGWLIVTPGFHRVHHSRDVHESNANFGSLLSWWDRLFRTARQHRSGIVFGVEGFEGERPQTLIGLVEGPLD